MREREREREKGWEKTINWGNNLYQLQKGGYIKVSCSVILEQGNLILTKIFGLFKSKYDKCASILAPMNNLKGKRDMFVSFLADYYLWISEQFL